MSSRRKGKRSAPARPPPASASHPSARKWYNRLDVTQKIVALVLGLVTLVGLLSGALIVLRSGGQPASSAIPSTSSPTTGSATSLQTKTAAIESLRPQLTLSQFTAKLGQPTLESGLASGAREFTFVDPLYYVQAIVQDETVVFFSVTTRSETFSPHFEFDVGSFGKLEVDLGRTTFAGAAEDPGDIGVFVGTQARIVFRDVQYFGNPGNYLTFFLGWNVAGLQATPGTPQDIRSYELIPTLDTAFGHPEFFPDHRSVLDNPTPTRTPDPSAVAVLTELRRHVAINTFGIAGPFLDYKVLKGALLGPDYVPVRVLN